MKTVLAVDLGGTKTATAIVTEHGAIAARHKLPAAHTLDGTVCQIARAAAANPAVDAIGVIVPGIFDPGTGMAWAPNLWGRDQQPLLSALTASAGKPLVLGSDRDGYVAGETWLGAAQGLSDVLFVAIGTGIGIGILSGGRILSGAHGTAGSAGWCALDPRWKPQYALTGGWESESAGPAVARLAGMESAEAVVQAAQTGDPRAIDALQHSAAYTGMGIANLISLFDPQMVVLGGGLMHAAGLLLDTIRSTAARWAQPISFPKVRIEVSRLGEDAGLLGAAWLALHKGSS